MGVIIGALVSGMNSDLRKIVNAWAMAEDLNESSSEHGALNLFQRSAFYSIAPHRGYFRLRSP
jgi:hypothetical protein